MFNTPESPAQVAPVALAPACDPDLAAAYVTALTGSVDTVMDWRCLSDTDKSLPGHARRGTLSEVWPWITGMNAAGYGCFVNVSEMDGHGLELANVAAVRAHVVDLDGIDADQQRAAAAQWSPAPSFQVETSPGRFHVYWVLSERYADNDRFTALQRRIRQKWNGDKAVIDPTRILRLPGTLNWKRAEPHPVRCEALAGYGQPLTVDQLEASLSHVVVQDGGNGERHELGTPALAAPSLEWLKRALELVDPNELDRDDWVPMSAAFKQAGWSLTDEGTLYALWSQWCAKYEDNSEAENDKLWRSIRDSKLGWPALVARVPELKAQSAFGDRAPPLPPGASDTRLPVAANDTAPARVLDASPITEAEWNDTAALTPRCIVENMYFADVGVRVAAGGVGKTTLALWEAMHLALQWPLFGNIVRRPGVTCILTSEDRRGMLVARLRKICEAMQLTSDQVATVMRSVRIAYVEQFRLTRIDSDTVIASDGVQEVINTFRPLAPSVIWIDPAVSFGVGESRVNDAEQGLILAGRMIRNAIPECAVMFIHHTGKSNAREKTLDQYSGRGGSALADGARMVQVMQSLTHDEWHGATGVPLHDDQTGFVMARAKSSYTLPQPLIYVRRCGWSFEIVAGQSTGDSLATAKELFMQLLGRLIEQGRYVNSISGQHYAPLVFSEHESAKGLTKQKFRNAMDALFSDGRIRNGPVGKGSKARIVILPVG